MSLGFVLARFLFFSLANIETKEMVLNAEQSDNLVGATECFLFVY